MAKTKSGRSDSKWVVEKHRSYEGAEGSGEVKRRNRRDERRKQNKRTREWASELLS